MDVAYCSLLLPEEKKLIERSKKRLPGVSLHKLSKALIAGFDENLDTPMKVFNIINTLNYPAFPQLVFKGEKWQHVPGAEDCHIGYVNLFGIKYIMQTVNLYRSLRKWRKNSKDTECVVCVHHIYLPMLLASALLKKKFGDKVHTCLITGDMSGSFGLTKKKKLTPKQYLIRYVEKAIDSAVHSFDSYVFATRAMATGYGVEDKPFVVIECAYNAARPVASQSDEDAEKVIFYAGALRDDYGLPHLLRAFSLIEDPSYRLRLAGGAATETIQKYMDQDSRIELLGFITPQDVEVQQGKATVLISPRTSEHEFVKYSFPSKTLECLASGKPYIAHRLPCDPPEYAAHVQYPENETDEALAEKIMEVCRMPAEKRREIGLQSRAFIEKEKNPAAMTKRIVDMWKNELH